MLRHREEIAAFELDCTALNNGIRGQEAQHGAPEHRLAGAGFANQSPHLAGLNLQAGAAQHIGCLAARSDRDMQIPDGEHSGHRRCTGSSAARRPSPRRLKPITLRITQPIGNAMIHGA